MTDHADIVRYELRGLPDALAALDALEAEIRSLNEQVVGAVDLLEGAVAERDEALARLSSIGGYEGYDNAWTALQRRAEAAEAERDEAKGQFWQQRHEWAAATGKNQEIIDALVAERDEALRERIRAEEAARVATALMEGAQQACGDLRARALAAEAELKAWKVRSVEWEKRARAAEAERDKFKGVVVLIASKKCLNGNSSCDWPCVVCIARAALGEDA